MSVTKENIPRFLQNAYFASNILEGSTGTNLESKRYLIEKYNSSFDTNGLGEYYQKKIFDLF